MANDIFTAVKGVTSPSDIASPQSPSSSTAEQAQRTRTTRLLRQNTNTQNALAFFQGKRLLGGNLLAGGGTAPDPFVTRSLFAEVQKNEDDAFGLLIRQVQERIAKNEFLSSPFNPVSSEERVARLLANAPQAREPQRYRYSSYDPESEKRRLEELQAHNDAILDAARSRLAATLQEGELPDVSQRPRIADLLSPRLTDTKLNGAIDFNLSRRLAHLDLDSSTPNLIVLDDLLRLRSPSSFIGLTTPTQIAEKQNELGLTDAQVEEQQKRDSAGVPTHVQVILQGRSLNLDPAFVERQRRIDPNFDIESHRSPAGSLVLEGVDLDSRTARGTLLRHTLTYAEYLKLEYKPPTTGSEGQIDYFSAIAFQHPDGSQAVLDEKATRSSVQTIALTTPETPPLSTSDTIHQIYDLSFPTESNSTFSEVEIIFEGTSFLNPATQNILEALQNGDLIIKATQQGYNKSYGNDRELTLDYEELRQNLGDLVLDDNNRVRFKFFAPELARNGVDLSVYVRLQGTPPVPALTLEGVRARFL